MKRFLRITFCIICCILTETSCSKQSPCGPDKVLYFAAPSGSDDFVEIGQIMEYVDKIKLATKVSAGATYSVMPYCGSTGDTLMYIVNYGSGDGWQILSSDARTPAVIAESESGFSQSRMVVRL